LAASLAHCAQIAAAMPAYHSGFPKDCASVCGLAMLPLKTKARGPAVCLDVGASEEDPVDEALRLFRANVLFRNFEVQGAPDRTLIYLTLLIHQARRAAAAAQRRGGRGGCARYIKQVFPHHRHAVQRAQRLARVPAGAAGLRFGQRALLQQAGEQPRLGGPSKRQAVLRHGHGVQARLAVGGVQLAQGQ
jgi:hypothetical protein